MDELVTPLESKTPSAPIVIIVVLLLAVLGVGAGYLLSKKTAAQTTTTTTAGSEMIQTKNEVGSTDTKTFRDSATGTIEAGGLNGEGTHKLIRDGGPSQTIYMISSVVDLSEFVGKKVEVWGETQKASKVSWLMDVGRVKLIE